MAEELRARTERLIRRLQLETVDEEENHPETEQGAWPDNQEYYEDEEEFDEWTQEVGRYAIYTEEDDLEAGAEAENYDAM